MVGRPLHISLADLHWAWKLWKANMCCHLKWVKTVWTCWELLCTCWFIALMRMVRELDTIPFKNGWNIYPSWPIGNYGSFDGHVMKIHSGSFDGQRWIILCSGLFWKFWVAIVQPDICDKTCPNLNCFRGELRYRYGTRVAKQLKGLKGCYINRPPAVLQVFNLMRWSCDLVNKHHNLAWMTNKVWQVAGVRNWKLKWKQL